MMVVVALVCFLVGHPRVGGAALLIAAVLAPTGWAFLVNGIVIILSIALVLLPEGKVCKQAGEEPGGASGSSLD